MIGIFEKWYRRYLSEEEFVLLLALLPLAVLPLAWRQLLSLLGRLPSMLEQCQQLSEPVARQAV